MTYSYVPFSLVEAKARLGFKAQAISCKVAGDPAGAERALPAQRIWCSESQN